MKKIKVQSLVAKARKEMGITRGMVAENVGLSYGTVQKLEMSGDDHVAMTQVNTMLKLLRNLGMKDAAITFTMDGEAYKLDM